MRVAGLEGYSPFKTTDLRDPVLGEIAERQGVTPAQVVIRAHRPRSRRDPNSASPERIASNFDVFGFALDDAELHQIDGLSGDVCGDTQRRRAFRDLPLPLLLVACSCRYDGAVLSALKPGG